MWPAQKEKREGRFASESEKGEIDYVMDSFKVKLVSLSLPFALANLPFQRRPRRLFTRTVIGSITSLSTNLVTSHTSVQVAGIPLLDYTVHLLTMLTLKLFLFKAALEKMRWRELEETREKAAKLRGDGQASRNSAGVRPVTTLR